MRINSKLAFISICLIAFISYNSNAQLDKGSKLLGLNGLINIPRTEGGIKASGFTLDSRLGFFAAHNFAIGPSFIYSTTRQSGVSSNSNFKSRIVAPGIFVRPYLLPRELPVNWFLDLAFNYGSILSEARGSKISNNTSIFAAGTGLSIFLNRNVSLDIWYQYVRQSILNKDSRISKFERHVINLSLQVYLFKKVANQQ